MPKSDASTYSPELAAAWAGMTSKQRLAFLRQGNVLNVSSSERQAAKTALIRKANQS